MLKLIRTNSSNSDFRHLVVQLDQYLKVSDGDDHAFFDQYNQLDAIKHVLVAYLNNEAVGCGAIKHYEDGVVEVKRMFVPVEQRGKGIASTMLMHLEQWAKELGYNTCILETGKVQLEAVALYQKNGYKIIPNYGQYIGVDLSICFRKDI